MIVPNILALFFMKIIKTTYLFYQKDNSDKVYEVELAELASDLYVVNFRYGRRGSALRSGTKNQTPVDRAKADKIFADLVHSKQKKGYQQADADKISADLGHSKQKKSYQQADIVRQQVVETCQLYYQQGSDDKVYQVDLCQVGDQGFVVNFRYGQRGSKLKNGTKHVAPVRKLLAEQVFHNLVKSKQKQGYYADVTIQIKTQQIPKLLAKLEQAIKQTDVDFSLDRLIWRVGELKIKTAIPLLYQLTQKHKNPLTQYCLAWALGRCATTDSNMLAWLNSVITDKKSPDYLKAIAKASYCQTVPSNELKQFQQSLLSALPENIRRAYQEQQMTSLKTAVKQYNKQAQQLDILTNLYLLNSEASRTVVLDFVRKRPLKYGYFNQHRRLFKLAELRQDLEVLAIYCYRFETVPDGSVNPSAYSPKTRDYLKRRLWRQLRRLGQQQDNGYCRLAGEILLQFKDSDMQSPQSYSFYNYDTDRKHKIHLDQSYPYFVFNHILYGNSPRYRPRANLKWQCHRYQPNKSKTPTVREEAFAEIWNQQPQVLLCLLQHSQCQLVHEFAVKALKTQTAYCNKLESKAFIPLLSSAYNITYEFGLELSKSYLTKQSMLDTELVLALLQCRLTEAHTIAKQQIEKYRPQLLADLEFLIEILINPYAEIRHLAQRLLAEAKLATKQQQSLVKNLLTKLKQMKQSNDTNDDIIKDIGFLLLPSYGQQLAKLPQSFVLQLLEHPLLPIQSLGGEILLQYADVKTLPLDCIPRLLGADEEALRILGMALFEKMPTDYLLSNNALLISFCLAEQADLRQSVQPVIKKLADESAEFAVLFTQTLSYYLFQPEPFEGVHATIINILQQVLSPFLTDIEEGKIWQMINANSSIIQSFGAYVLSQHYDKPLNFNQLLKLHQHQLKRLRDYAKQQIQQQGISLSQAIQLLDVTWQDSLDFAINHIKTQYHKDDFSAELVLALCDHQDPQIQTLGLELMQPYLQHTDNPHSFLQLSQHPSISVQQFVGEYLDNYASEQIQTFAQLSDYFIQILSRINQARQLKNRLLDFFAKQALVSREFAEIIAKILSRVSATVAIEEKAQMIEIMCYIKKHYPDIELPINICAIPVRTKN